jgi:hypothetical protein
MKVVRIAPDGNMDIVEFPDKECGDKINELVGGIFDCISLPRLGLDLWVHDEGLLLNMELNIFAETLWEAEYEVTGGHIVGPVVITGLADDEGFSTSVPEAFLNKVIIPSMHTYESCKLLVEE